MEVQQASLDVLQKLGRPGFPHGMTVLLVGDGKLAELREIEQQMRKLSYSGLDLLAIRFSWHMPSFDTIPTSSNPNVACPSQFHMLNTSTPCSFRPCMSRSAHAVCWYRDVDFWKDFPQPWRCDILSPLELSNSLQFAQQCCSVRFMTSAEVEILMYSICCVEAVHAWPLLLTDTGSGLQWRVVAALAKHGNSWPHPPAYPLILCLLRWTFSHCLSVLQASLISILYKRAVVLVWNKWCLPHYSKTAPISTGGVASWRLTQAWV